MTERQDKFRRLCLLFGAAAALLLCWRWQRIFYLMCADYIRSDMPAHIRLALGHNDYSLASWLVRALWALLGEERGETALSLILTANQLFGIAAVWLLLLRLFPALDGGCAFLAALLGHVVGPWILPGQSEMYLGAFNGNILHNMTMLFSRSFVPLCLLFFYRLWETRRERTRIADWLGLMLSLLLATLLKPSFLGAFAPAVFGLLVWDFCATRGRGFGREFLLGLAFIPALAALVWSSSVLYAEDFAGTSSGLALRALTLPLFASLLLKYLRGMLLPVWSFAVQGGKEERRGELSIFMLVLAVSIAEAILLTETGFRANDGNYEWGSLTLYPVLFAQSIALLMRMPREQGAPRRRLAFGLALLLGHLAVGAVCLWRPGHAGYDWFYF